MQQTSSDDRKQTLCLALALYHEARGEPSDGQIAVGDVIHNRIRSSGLSVCQTLWKTAQFPWTRKPNRALTPRETAAWESMQQTALALRRSDWTTDLTHGATFFYNARLCHPDWAIKGVVTARIGDHVFLRP